MKLLCCSALIMMAVPSSCTNPEYWNKLSESAKERNYDPAAFNDIDAPTPAPEENSEYASDVTNEETVTEEDVPREIAEDIPAEAEGDRGGRLPGGQ
jgi:hypothetical protein